jgi:hypothetical protein
MVQTRDLYSVARPTICEVFSSPPHTFDCCLFRLIVIALSPLVVHGEMPPPWFRVPSSTDRNGSGHVSEEDHVAMSIFRVQSSNRPIKFEPFAEILQT